MSKLSYDVRSGIIQASTNAPEDIAGAVVSWINDGDYHTATDNSSGGEGTIEIESVTDGWKFNFSTDGAASGWWGCELDPQDGPGSSSGFKQNTMEFPDSSRFSIHEYRAMFDGNPVGRTAISLLFYSTSLNGSFPLGVQFGRIASPFNPSISEIGVDGLGWMGNRPEIDTVRSGTANREQWLSQRVRDNPTRFIRMGLQNWKNLVNVFGRDIDDWENSQLPSGSSPASWIIDGSDQEANPDLAPLLRLDHLVRWQRNSPSTSVGSASESTQFMAVRHNTTSSSAYVRVEFGHNPLGAPDVDFS